MGRRSRIRSRLPAHRTTERLRSGVMPGAKKGGRKNPQKEHCTLRSPGPSCTLRHIPLLRFSSANST